MSETEQKVSQVYLGEVYSAIAHFTQSQVNYSVILTELKLSEKKTDSEIFPLIQQYINGLRLFEQHAFLRLSAIKEQANLDLSKIEEQRKTLEQKVPNTLETFKLALEYHKIVATKLTDNMLVSSQQMAGELTGKL